MRRFPFFLFFVLLVGFVLVQHGVIEAKNVDVTGSIIDKYKPEPITNFMSDPVTPLAKQVRSNTYLTSVLIIPFLILPQILLLICIFKFKKTNDGRKPATFHENLPLEVVWTLIPALVLILMAVPTYNLIRDFENPPPADMIISIRGQQYIWQYDYLERGLIVTSYDTPLVIPVGKNIVANLTSNDVNHAWWVPAFGVKMDAVAGRTNQVWFNVERTGWYEGQCAEICGAGHAQMWIDVVVVTEEEFEQWLVEKGATGPDDSSDEAVAVLPALPSAEQSASESNILQLSDSRTN